MQFLIKKTRVYIVNNFARGEQLNLIESFVSKTNTDYVYQLNLRGHESVFIKIVAEKQTGTFLKP